MPPTTSSCAIRVEHSPAWPVANGYFGAVLNIFISNMGDQVVQTPWQLQLSGDVYNQVISSWNWQPAVANGIISGSGSEPWLAMQPNGEEYNIGLIVRGTSDTPADYIPTTATLNGVVCGLIARSI